MKKSIFLAVVFGLFASFAIHAGETAECRPDDAGQVRVAPVATEELEGRRFRLVRVDAKAYAGEKRPYIEFGPDMAVFGSICNSFRGSGRLESGVLYAGPFAATMMLCLQDDLSSLEARMFTLLEAGMVATWEDGELILRAEGAELAFAAEEADPHAAETQPEEK